MQTIQHFFQWLSEKLKRQSIAGKVSIGCSTLFILCCLCSVPIVFFNNISSNPNKSSENLLVGRHPEQWMPNSSTFIAINSNVPLLGRFAYPGEQEGITSYGFNWHEPTCSKAMSSSISLGEVYVILYKSTLDAINVYSKYTPPPFKDDSQAIFQNQENSSLRTGNTGEIWFYQYKSCETTAYYAIIMFRRNNILGIANAETFQKNSGSNLREIVLDLGSQLDQIIQNEINNHPGSESDLIKVSNSARTIELPSVTNPSANDSGNDTGSFGTNDPSTDEGCIHSVYAGSKMCDEEYQFLQSQDP